MAFNNYQLPSANGFLYHYIPTSHQLAQLLICVDPWQGSRLYINLQYISNLRPFSALFFLFHASKHKRPRFMFAHGG